MNILSPEAVKGKPFLKWAGGKGQLIAAIKTFLPGDLGKRKDLTYIEPFVGSGAVMFWFLQQYPNARSVIINDINSDLTNAYTIVKEDPYGLIGALKNIQDKYRGLTSEADRRSFFLEKREEYNTRQPGALHNAALLIFLNRTCFNGLYRVNSKNFFNVPFGKYVNPAICDPETIIADSHLLQRVTILNGDYKETVNYVREDTFFYFDPPYKPISKTSSFNAYARDIFDDREQTRLKMFCDELTQRKCQWLLSNSDPKNIDPNDSFFDDLYSDASVVIDRVKARRNINSNSSARGAIYELLISNYKKDSQL